MAGKKYADPLLTMLSLGFRPFGHINQMVLPVLNVIKPTAKLAKYDGANMRIVSTVKSPSGDTPKIEFNTEQIDSYNLVRHAIANPVTVDDLENQDRPFNAMRDAMEINQDVLSLEREFGLSKFMSTASNFTNKTQLSGTGQWGQSADDPVGDISTAIQSSADAAHVTDEMISLVLSKKAFRILQYDDDILERLGFTANRAGSLTKEELKKAFGVVQVLVGEGQYNTAEEGQTEVFSDLWGNHAWAVYINPRPKLKARSFGYTTRRKAALLTDRWFDDDPELWWVRSKDEYDQFILDEASAFFIEDAVPG